MPMPCESWPIRFAVTRFSATMRASRASLPPLATIASIARIRFSLRKVSFMSLRFDAATLHHLGPALDFLVHEFSELLRRARHHVEADLRHALADVRGAQRFHGRVVQLRYDFARRLRRRGHRLP